MHCGCIAESAADGDSCGKLVRGRVRSRYRGRASWDAITNEADGKLVRAARTYPAIGARELCISGCTSEITEARLGVAECASR